MRISDWGSDLCSSELIEGISLHGLLTQLEIDPGIAPDVPVLAGGPVEPQRGFVLHSQDWAGEGSVQIGNSYTLTSTLDVLKAIAEGQGPGRWLVALGYAGVDAGQLDEEFTHHRCLQTPFLSDLLFFAAVERRLGTALAA